MLQAAFEHSYFVEPDRVRQNTPRYPDRARYSREGTVKLADFQEVPLSDMPAKSLICRAG